MDIKQLWTRRDRATRVSLVVGVVLAVLAVPLPTLVALAVGLAAAAALGYTFPGAAFRVGVLVAAPILAVAFIVGLVRGFAGPPASEKRILRRCECCRAPRWGTLRR